MKRFVFFALLIGMIVFSVSCQNPEDVTISKYFAALKHGDQGDRDTMNSMSVDPKYIQYKEYKIEGTEPLRELDMQLPLLEKKQADLTAARNEQGKKAQEANDQMEDIKYELEGVARGSKKVELEAKLAEAETVKKDEEAKFKQFQAQINHLKKMIESEKNLIKISANVSENFDFYTGKALYQDVKVKVTADDGSQTDYVFVLTKYDLAMEGKPLARSRFIILKIMTAADAAQEETPEEYYRKVLTGTAAVEQPAEAPAETPEEAPAETPAQPEEAGQ
jgi:hypothetical protein